MIGADHWIYRNHYRKFTRKWWLEWLTMPREIIRHWVERAARGYSVYDMFNGNEYLSDVISGAAYWLFANAHGHPDRMTHEEWLDILLEIRDGFSARNEYDDPTVPHRAWDLLRDNFDSIWD
jgi:hypothetical protein